MIRKLNKLHCLELLDKNYIGHLAYVFENKPYVVPITYFLNNENNSIVCYSGEGHKIKALRNNKNISLEVSTINSVNSWKSVLVHGLYQEFEGSAAKLYLHKFAEGVKKLIQKKERRDLKFLSEFSSKIFKEGLPVVFEIKIEDITGRERNFHRSLFNYG